MDICPPRNALHGCKHTRTPPAAVGTWKSSQELCSEQEVTAAMGGSPRRRRRGHRRVPGIKPLEMERDSGGPRRQISPSLWWRTSVVLAKAAQTQRRSPKHQGGSPGAWGCPDNKTCTGGQTACECQGHVWHLSPRGLAPQQSAIPHRHSAGGIQSVPVAQGAHGLGLHRERLVAQALALGESF